MSTQSTSPVYRWLIFAITGSGVFLATSAVTIVNVALPFITKDFQSEISVTQWVVLIYLLTTSSLMINFGRLGDIFTPYRLHYAGLIVFTGGSLLCSFAPSAEMLIALRILQGLGGAMIVSNGPGTVTAAFPAEQRGRIIGLQAGVVGFSLSIGPTIAGFLIGWFGWRSVFLYNVPFGIMGILIGWLIPAPKRELKTIHIDFVGGILLFITIITLVLGINRTRDLGVSSPLVLVYLGCFVVSLLVFFLVEMRVSHPMLDLRLFRNRIFAIAQAGNFLSHMATFGIFLLMPFYLVRILEVSAQDTGLILLPLTVTMVILSPFSGALADRFGSRGPSVLGVTLICLGLYSLISLNPDSSVIGIVLRLTLLGVGRAVYMSPNTTATLASASRERAGVAGGVHATMRHLGNLSGIAVVGTYFSARQAVRLADTSFAGSQEAHRVASFMGPLQETFTLSLAIAALALLITLFQRTAHPRP